MGELSRRLRFKIEEPVFKSCLHVFVNWELDKVKKAAIALKNGFEWDTSDYNEHTGGCFVHGDNGDVLIWLNDVYVEEGVPTWTAWERIFHESGHAANCVENNIGIRDTRDECRLYLQGYFAKTILRKIQKANKNGQSE